jgi:hypothetical protein
VPLPLQPLTPEELAEAKSAIEGLVEKGQTLNLKTQARAMTPRPRRAVLVAARSTRVPALPQVKPEIIAGLVVEIGDKYLVRSSGGATRRSQQCRHPSPPADALGATGLVAGHAHPQDGAAAAAAAVSGAQLAATAVSAARARSALLRCMGGTRGRYWV